MTDLTSPDFRTSDGTFKVTHRNDEVHFELGFQNRNKKSAIYKNGTIAVDIRATRPEGTLPKKECAAILNMVVTCVRLPECSEGRIFENFAMAGQSYFNRLEEMPYSPPETSIMFAPLSARASHTSQSRLAACSAAIRICRMWVKLDCKDSLELHGEYRRSIASIHRVFWPLQFPRNFAGMRATATAAVRASTPGAADRLPPSHQCPPGTRTRWNIPWQGFAL